MGFLGCSATGWAEADVVAPAPALAGFDVGCELCAVAAEAPVGTTLRVFGAALDWAGGFVCGSAWPGDGAGNLAPEGAATEACTFDDGAVPAWTPSDCCCMYHQPPPASSKTPAAIAPIRMPLLELRDPLSRMLFSSSAGMASSNMGRGNSGMWCASAAVRLSGAVSSAVGCSVRCFAFSLSISSWVEEGAAALRARGSRHAG